MHFIIMRNSSPKPFNLISQLSTSTESWHLSANSRLNPKHIRSLCKTARLVKKTLRTQIIYPYNNRGTLFPTHKHKSMINPKCNWRFIIVIKNKPVQYMFDGAYMFVNSDWTVYICMCYVCGRFDFFVRQDIDILLVRKIINRPPLPSLSNNTSSVI